MFGQKSNASNMDFHYFIRDEYSSKKKPFGLLYLLGDQVPRSCFLLRNGTLIICIPWIIERPWIPRGRLFGLFSGVPSKKEHLSKKGTFIQRNTHPRNFVCQTQGNLALNYFCFPNMAFFYFLIIFFGSPGTTPDAPIGLWTLSPRFLSGFTSP